MHTYAYSNDYERLDFEFESEKEKVYDWAQMEKSKGENEAIVV